MTQTLKTLIVDDEEHCRNALQRKIKEYCPQIEVVDSVNSVSEARKSLHNLKPDLIFLDVEMPSESGFDFLDQLTNKTIPIIFTTAHESYALRALKKRALDYLLKPVDGQDLIKAVNKTDEPRVAQSVSQSGRVALPTTQGLLFFDPDEIIRCEADGSYSKVYTETKPKPVLVSRNLGWVEKEVPSSSFFRVHKSHLVNLEHVTEYIRGSGGFAVMSDGSHIEISKRKREDFLLALR
jgi:two-component system LytT family response regulator